MMAQDIKEIMDVMSKYDLKKFNLQYDKLSLNVEFHKEEDYYKDLICTSKDPLIIHENKGMNMDRDIKTVEKEHSIDEFYNKDIVFIKAPLLGVYYEAPAPCEEKFIKKGDYIETGDVLCIIEAMKLMNEIKSEFSGEILEIYVEDGQIVEYGEKMFKIKQRRHVDQV